MTLKNGHPSLLLAYLEPLMLTVSTWLNVTKWIISNSRSRSTSAVQDTTVHNQWPVTVPIITTSKCFWKGLSVPMLGHNGDGCSWENSKNLSKLIALHPDALTLYSVLAGPDLIRSPPRGGTGIHNDSIELFCDSSSFYRCTQYERSHVSEKEFQDAHGLTVLTALSGWQFPPQPCSFAHCRGLSKLVTSLTNPLLEIRRLAKISKRSSTM